MEKKDAALSQGKKHVDAAVSQGEKHVDVALSQVEKDAKAVGAGYVEQIRGLAQSAIDTAKVIISQRGGEWKLITNVL